MLGTDEPIYPDPSPELLAAAAQLRAEVSPARLRTLVESIPGPRSRLHAPEAMIRADEVISDAWTTAGWEVERQPLHLRGEWGLADGPGHGRTFKGITRHAELNGVNLMATLPGRETDAIVIAAHLDTVFRSPGADDNAAGVVVLMEVA
ncbi:MAG: M28 family peptidase, partial [Chloroflexota bacterium]